MSEVTVSVRGLSGEVTLQVPEGSTVADVREAAEIHEGLSIRANGETVRDESSTPVEDESILVTSAPAAKHG
jgi:hypothetical protein